MFWKYRWEKDLTISQSWHQRKLFHAWSEKFKSFPAWPSPTCNIIVLICLYIKTTSVSVTIFAFTSTNKHDLENSREWSLFYLPIFLFTMFFFFPTVGWLLLWFPFCLERFLHLGSVCWWQIFLVLFCLRILIFPLPKTLFLNIFTGYMILGCQFFSFSTCEMYYFLLASVVSDDNLLFELLFMCRYHFSLVSWFSSLSWFFEVCDVVAYLSLGLPHSEFTQLLKSLGLYLPKLGSLQPFFPVFFERPCLRFLFFHDW